MYYSFHKKQNEKGSSTDFNTDNEKKCTFNHQISILEYSITEDLMNSCLTLSFAITVINYILKIF